MWDVVIAVLDADALWCAGAEGDFYPDGANGRRMRRWWWIGGVGR